MDPMIRVRDFLLDNVGHMTHPGTPSFDPKAQRWHVPIYCRTERGNVVVGDVELDRDGHIIFAPSKEEMGARLDATSATAAAPAS
jgi:hypothetical protein